jgi:hypothetical protein
MKNIRLLNLEKYSDFVRYNLIEEGIYIDLDDSSKNNYRIVIVYELEEGEDSQFLLKGLLDEFCLYVSDFMESEKNMQNQVKVVLAGTLEDVQKIKTILGKRVYNKGFLKDGKISFELIIEEIARNEDQHHEIETLKKSNISCENVKFPIEQQFNKFSEIQHLLPIDHWARWRNELHQGKFNDEICLYISGDYEVENLNLDEVQDELGNYIFLILVLGNMKVKNIYCKDNEKNTGLVVLGSLKAENIIVSRQEIYVCDNLTIKDCFLGDFNHGVLIVKGIITIQIFSPTDYRFNFESYQKEDRLKLNCFLWDKEENEEDAGFPRWKVSGIFREDCLVGERDIKNDLYSWNDWLDKNKMIECLKVGKSILQDSIEFKKPAIEIPFVFENNAFNNVNFQRLRESPLFMNNLSVDSTDGTQELEYWSEGDFKRVSITNGELCSEKVYFQQEDRAVLIQYERVNQNLFQTVFGEKPKYEISVLCRTIIEGVDDNWYHYNSLLEEHKKFRSLMENFWKDLLIEWSQMEYYHKEFQKTVTIEKIEHILSLPVVKAKYSNYYDDDEVLWFRKFLWKFRQKENTTKKCQRIAIVHSISTEENEIYDFYHFDIITLPNGIKAPVLYNQDTNGYNSEPYEVSKSNVTKFKNALRYFEIMERKIEQINNKYQEEIIEQEKYRQKTIAEIPYFMPINMLEFEGHQFKVISVHQASGLLKDIKDLEEKKYLYGVFDTACFPNYDKEGYFLLAEDDIVVSKLELPERVICEDVDIKILGIIFLKNLTVRSHIRAYNMGSSPALIIKGDLNCKNIHLVGNTHYIEGTVSCEFLYAQNHGSLYVKERFMGDCLVVRDMPCFFGELVAQAIISNHSIYGLDCILDEQDNIKDVLNFYPNTHFLEDVLIPEAVGEEMWDGMLWPDNMDSWIGKNKSVIDRTKDLQYKTLTNENIAERFDAIFSHELLATETYIITGDENKYTYKDYEWNGKHYREVRYKKMGYLLRHQLRILHNFEENTYTAYLEYLNDITDEVKLRFSTTLADTSTSTKAVKHAFCVAELALGIK